ncbi:MAG: hypothetical protein HUK24_09000 [Sphaerochaetaceae bacterium]|nr:hypothetical protein [Sphaerochaetaceae bacterium]
MSNKKSRIYQKQASEIKDRLNGRDYILGLGLGVGLIGSAVVAIDTINGETLPIACLLYKVQKHLILFILQIM